MKVKKETAMLISGGISLLIAEGECGRIDAKDSAERGVGDYFFDFGDRIDRNIGRDSGIWNP